MPTTVDFARNPPHITLGALSLPAERYTLKAEVPVTRKTLCDGSHLVTPLAPLPCVLICSGRLPAADAASLPAALTAALAAHTRYAFPFCGAELSAMLLTAAECSADGKTASYTLTMQGMLAPEEEDDDA